MKKLMLMAAALSLSGAALAQDATPMRPGTAQSGTTPQDTTMPDPATNAPADTGTMQPMQNDPAMAQPMQTNPGQSMQPGTNNGTMPMQTPKSGSMSNGSMSGMQPGMASGEYPRCSRTVTDRCTQVASGTPRARRRR